MKIDINKLPLKEEDVKLTSNINWEFTEDIRLPNNIIYEFTKDIEDIGENDFLLFDTISKE